MSINGVGGGGKFKRTNKNRTGQLNDAGRGRSASEDKGGGWTECEM